MNKKLPFLVAGYFLGALALVVSISSLAYTKAVVGSPVTDGDSADNCKDI